MIKTYLPVSVIAAVLSLPLFAQQQLTLEQCREMAVTSSHELSEARTKVEIAGYDRKIARANYFPEISATGAYLYNNRNISLIDDPTSSILQNGGSLVQSQLDAAAAGIFYMIESNPSIVAAMQNMPELMQAYARLKGMKLDVATPLTEAGTMLDEKLHLDIHNVYIGTVTLKQPVFVGGKIVLSNKMAGYAEDLAKTQYEQKYGDILLDVDQAYWQIVSVSAKKKLAQSYSDLLHLLEKDVDAAVREGVATRSDELQIKVKANEADMMLSKATNGLILAKMLLCKQIGLPLDSDITLADEDIDTLAEPAMEAPKDMETIFADRAETRSLDLATKIYDTKAGIARADMLPSVALLANFAVTNPNSFHGYSNSFRGGLFSAGVMVKVPIFHGTEALQKTRKARAEAMLYRDQLANARDLITLQVSQSRQHYDEALQHLHMSESNLEHAEENLRTATVGYENGIIETSTVLGAQTAWLQAHSEYIDAAVGLRIAIATLQKAEGSYHSEK